MNRQKHLMFSLLAIAALALSAAACSKNQAEEEPPAEESSSAEKTVEGSSAEGTEEAETATGEATPEGVAKTLAAYEEIRARLAEDDVAVADGAAALQELANDANLEGIAAAAGELGEVGEDPAAVRKAFGEVSREVVALLSSDEKLAEGKHVFECPMAKGYQKWVQPSAELSNPYMGTSMPKCGSETEWSP